MKQRFLFLILILLAAIPLAFTTAQDANTLVYAYGQDTTNFNPVTQTLGADSFGQGFIMVGIWEQDQFTGLPESGKGITTWEISEDGLTYTFQIRENANWSDGTPFTSQDVKFTFEAVLSPNVQSSRSNWMNNIAAINIIDEKNFEIVLREVNCSIWNDISARILPSFKFAPDYSDFMDNAFNTFADVSSGPYLLAEKNTDEFMRFEANPNYFKGVPNIDNIIVRVIPDSAVRKQALLAGEIDIPSGVSAGEAEEFAGNPDVTVYTFPVNEWFNLVFNLADPTNPMPARDEDGNLNDQGHHPIFGDVRVRKAIAMGWNKDDVLTLLGEGTQRIVGSVTPAISWAYASDIEPYAYDPEAAAALLDEAGWTDEDGDGVRECHGCLYAEEGTPLEFQLDSSVSQNYYQNTAAIIVDYLSQIGIKVNYVGWEYPALQAERLVPQIFDALIVEFGWSIPEPHALTNFFLHSSNDNLASLNFPSYATDEMDALIEEAATLPGCDPVQRAALYHQIQQITHDEVISDFISDKIGVVVTRARVGNIEPWSWGSNDRYEWTLAE